MKLRSVIDYGGTRATSGLKCPACGSRESRVIDSRRAAIADLGTITRRRCCADCNKRYLTVEINEEQLGSLWNRLRDQILTRMKAKIKDMTDDLFNSF